jgi:putative tricarboxylic transport membrane protein
MSDSPEPRAHRAAGISARSMEIVVAVIVFGLGALVVFDSHRLGSSWGPDGPEAGYFPFYIGLIICISSAVILGQALVGKVSRSDRVFVEWQPLRQVLAVLLPALVYVLAIQLIGMYVASVIYIAGFMVWLGSYGWVKSALLGIAVSAVAFVTFEIWFQVPLYKGVFNPLAFLGY